MTGRQAVTSFEVKNWPISSFIIAVMTNIIRYVMISRCRCKEHHRSCQCLCCYSHCTVVIYCNLEFLPILAIV